MRTTVASGFSFVYYSCSLERQSAVSVLTKRKCDIVTIDEMLAGARSRLARVTPEQAFAEVAAGAVLVDIRPAAQRALEGEIPGAIVIERNVLEWRLDPRSSHRLPIADYPLRIIVVCSEGYTSSLAAASLLDLGLVNATDLEGGFREWQASGLPVN